VVSWVGRLEYDRFALPRPDRQILLDASVELAAQRARHRAEQEADRARDAYERDAGLQQRGPWSVVAPDVDPATLARSLHAG
jgi:dTMP kinase